MLKSFTFVIFFLLLLMYLFYVLLMFILLFTECIVCVLLHCIFSCLTVLLCSWICNLLGSIWQNKMTFVFYWFSLKNLLCHSLSPKYSAPCLYKCKMFEHADFVFQKFITSGNENISPKRWFGRRETIEWPDRFPNFTFLDFFLYILIVTICFFSVLILSYLFQYCN